MDDNLQKNLDSTWPETKITFLMFAHLVTKLQINRMGELTHVKRNQRCWVSSRPLLSKLFQECEFDCCKSFPYSQFLLQHKLCFSYISLSSHLSPFHVSQWKIGKFLRFHANSLQKFTFNWHQITRIRLITRENIKIIESYMWWYIKSTKSSEIP